VAGARGGQGTSTVAAAVALFAAGHRPTRLVATEPDAVAALLGITAPSPRDARPAPVTERLELANEPVDDDETLTVVDAGRVEYLPVPTARSMALVVLRGPCYLAVRTLVSMHGPRPDGIVLARERGRSLTASDVADVTGVSVIAELDVTPRIARTIDAGLLISRHHHLAELAPLRRWTAQQLTARRQRPSRAHPQTAPLTAVNDQHRLSHLRQGASRRHVGDGVHRWLCP
jgi:hypothetical protein